MDGKCASQRALLEEEADGGFMKLGWRTDSQFRARAAATTVEGRTCSMVAGLSSDGSGLSTYGA